MLVMFIVQLGVVSIFAFNCFYTYALDDGFYKPKHAACSLAINFVK
jgi:hypothetical protein